MQGAWSNVSRETWSREIGTAGSYSTAGKHKLDNHAPDIYNNTRVILYILYITRLYIIYANLHRPESARAVCKNFLLSAPVKNFYLPPDLLLSCKNFFIPAHTAYII